MDKMEALARLRAHEADLRDMGVARLSLFGSTARGDQRADSDVDLAATLVEGHRLNAFDFVGIQMAAADILGIKVDLVSEPARKPGLQAEIDRDRVHVF
ncbi:nucleotidyltransferase family protein [Sphingomonas oligophenolica]|uniref:DNA polymerase III subunit beta n=1 Tax=Sphingomonas oligophenolica TaxID=301154 RepID=A0A502CGS1_9SPHN|nr:nucleotidyltransferase domain-containing protein [Sphingomonas oligophenolica]TPG12168.1 DNA polymerase III subunit beta [Sphingomonas oligophenolica]